jgi:pimeloyl-ACP methyl ester carboxylesterase
MQIVETDGAAIAWEATGEGEPLLLIQGLGFSGEMWYRVVPLLAKQARVIVFDNRGTGATGAPPGPYTIETMANDALAVLDAAGVNRAHVLGISMGGLIAQQVAMTAPGRVLSLTLAATSSGDPDVAEPAPPEVAQTLATRASLPPRESIEVMIPFAYASTTPREWIEEDTQRRLDNRTTPEGYMGQLMGASQWRGSVEKLGELHVPTLVIHGTHDGMVRVRNAYVLAEAIPGAELSLVDGAGHVLITDVPERFAEVVLDFIGRAA